MSARVYAGPRRPERWLVSYFWLVFGNGGLYSLLPAVCVVGSWRVSYFDARPHMRFDMVESLLRNVDYPFVGRNQLFFCHAFVGNILIFSDYLFDLFYLGSFDAFESF